MNLEKLHHIIEEYLTQPWRHENVGEYPVVVTTKDWSAGPRASVGVGYVSLGMDWEKGQVRISPSEDIISVKYHQKKLDAVREGIKPFSQEFSVGTVWYCTNCDRVLDTEWKFCPRCGARILWK